MTTVHSFAPIVDASAHTLILGSMPGIASLDAGEYYAHSRNAFWPIMGALTTNGIAVWDVLKLCTRHGSLDSAIVESSIETNDLAGLLDEHRSIERIFFNGAKAQNSFQRYVAPLQRTLTTVRLPSTSPANASLSFERKLDAWRVIAP
jgi:TDG/mug DNA glycosylase family protein